MRVLTGDACAGSAADREPRQPRPGESGPNDVCDTTVDNVENPAMWVTCKDHQQYPKYLIIFLVVSS